MSIRNIRTLSLNPHFYAILLCSFLSGYGRKCEVKALYMALPLLLRSDSREKLLHANTSSKFCTLFGKNHGKGENHISEKSRLSDFCDSYDLYQSHCSDAIIILSSEGRIMLQGRYITLLENVDYKNYKGSVKDFMRCAYYLGIIFASSSFDEISYYLGVECK